MFQNTLKLLLTLVCIPCLTFQTKESESHEFEADHLKINLGDDNSENHTEPSTYERRLEEKFKNQPDKLKYLKLLSAVNKALKQPCLITPSFSSSFNAHKQILDSVFNIDIQLLKLTAELLTDFLTGQNPVKVVTLPHSKEPEGKSKGRKKNKSKPSKGSSSDAQADKRSRDAALASTLKGMMKNHPFLHSTTLLLPHSSYRVKLAYQRDKQDNIEPLKKFPKGRNLLL